MNKFMTAWLKKTNKSKLWVLTLPLYWIVHIYYSIFVYFCIDPAPKKTARLAIARLGMKLETAQALSPIGVAVWGNPVMKDVVWPKNTPTPYLWIGYFYRELTHKDKIEYYRQSDLWEPIDDTNWVMKLRKEDVCGD